MAQDSDMPRGNAAVKRYNPWQWRADQHVDGSETVKVLYNGVLVGLATREPRETMFRVAEDSLGYYPSVPRVPTAKGAFKLLRTLYRTSVLESAKPVAVYEARVLASVQRHQRETVKDTRVLAKRVINRDNRNARNGNAPKIAEPANLNASARQLLNR